MPRPRLVLLVLRGKALVSNRVGLSLNAAVAAASELQPIAVSSERRREAVDFVLRRLEQLLVDDGVPVEAGKCTLFALATGITNTC